MSGAARHADVWPPLYDRARSFVLAWARGVNGFAVAGRENIPDGRGCLVVCNHLADPDGMFVAAALPPGRPGIHLVTARHHQGAPLVGELLLRLGLEPVRTDGTEVSALRHARRVMQGGGIVVIYPEGVPGYSSRVQPFAEGVGWLALTPGIEVIPAAVWGTQHVLRRGLPIGRGPVRVAFGPAVRMDGIAGARDRRVPLATARTRAAVQRLVGALRDAP
jgi:1-acyl-sn-glycerol-3-phosphate acyltransferase